MLCRTSRPTITLSDFCSTCLLRSEFALRCSICRDFGSKPVSVGAILLFLSISGCFSERSFPLRPGDFVQTSSLDDFPGNTREWLKQTHKDLKWLLPREQREALLTEDLAELGRNHGSLREHFKLTGRMGSLRSNSIGISHTAQAAGGGPYIEEVPDSWPGFVDVRIPVSEDLYLSGRIAYAQENGKVAKADCIVLVPGIFGDNGVIRTRDIALALLRSGKHVLAVELRGHGQTEAEYPGVFYTFGILETVDLLRVSEWLGQQPEVKQTGLIGFCWGGNLGVLAGWYDGMEANHPSITGDLRKKLPELFASRHYQAGILCFSVVWKFEEMLEDLEIPRKQIHDPTLHAIQQLAIKRCKRKHHPEITRSLKKLIEFEISRSELHYDKAVEDGLKFLRLMPFRGKPAGNKLASVRVPLLVVHGANDPLCPSPHVAEVFADLENPLVAGIVLPGGGHVGFAPYARSYFFSLMLNFFDAGITNSR